MRNLTIFLLLILCNIFVEKSNIFFNKLRRSVSSSDLLFHREAQMHIGAIKKALYRFDTRLLEVAERVGFEVVRQRK